MTGDGLDPQSIDRGHSGASGMVVARALQVGGWACSYHEGGPPQSRPPLGDPPAWATGCHYCRIIRVAQYVNGELPPLATAGPIAERLGVTEGTKVDALDVIRAACEIADDHALIAIIDRIAFTRTAVGT